MSLVTTALGVGPDIAAAVAGSEAPLHNTPWPVCVEATDQYCLEGLTITPPGGEERDVDTPTSGGYSEPWVVVSSYENNMGWINIAVAFYKDLVGFPTSGTEEGIDEGVYGIRIRLGSYIPSYLLAQGLVQDFKTSVSEDGNRTVEMSLSPKLVARPGSPGIACGGFTNLPPECETASAAVKNYLQVTLMMVPETEPLANQTRDIWISTNASSFTHPTFNIDERSVSAMASGPHYLPVDYSENCAAEDLESDGTGKCLTPAFYVTYIPFKTISFLTNVPIEILKSFISEDAIRAEVAGEVARNIDLVVSDSGITVDLNIRHFSQPNPKIKFKAIKTLKAGTTSSRTNFITVPQGASLTSFSFGKMSSRGLCTQQFSTIKAATNKRGFCVVNWSYKKAGSRQTISKKTAIRIIR